jgi:hypothetical protein
MIFSVAARAGRTFDPAATANPAAADRRRNVRLVVPAKAGTHNP